MTHVPVTKNIVIQQGAHCSETINLVANVDYSALTLSGKARKWYGSNTSYTFVCTGALGSVTIQMANTVTYNMDPVRYVYDIYGANTGANTVDKLITGMATVYSDANY